MKAPWKDKTGLPRTIAILAVVASVSFGLCGVTYLGGGLESANETLNTFLGYSVGVESVTCIFSLAAIGILALILFFKPSRE